MEWFVVDIAELANSTHFKCDALKKNVCEILVRFIFGQKDTIKVW